jgi:hypothetical protein
LLPIGAIGAAFLRFILAGLRIAHWAGSTSVLRTSSRWASLAASVCRCYA